MTTRDIRTSGVDASCDMCGRTLLRGERAETYIDGGERRAVCELCTTRAVQAGWLLEGTMPPRRPEAAGERRRSLLSRLRERTPGRGEEEEREVRERPPAAPARRRLPREPRHVRAVPTSAEHKVASAVETFNGSEHPRTIAGVARSLGAPCVSVRPSDAQSSLVNVVASWELCWYRYEVDLADEQASVRLSAQGYELSELPEVERIANAAADEHGELSLQ